MKYDITFTDKAKKQFDKLDSFARVQITRYIEKYFVEAEIPPRSHGKPLTGALKGYWRYEIGKYRLICEICDNVFTVIVIKIGHRREIYR
jgi:mRNA interferase RelE/StbE